MFGRGGRLAVESEFWWTDFANFFWSRSQSVSADFSSLSSVNRESGMWSGMRADITATVDVPITEGGEGGAFEMLGRCINSILVGK